MKNKYDILIREGLVVSGSRILKADVGIRGEKIASVEPRLPDEEAAQVIEASGKYVMPGVIDAHVHPVYEDDMGGLSLTAAHGGTTTLIHFAYAKPGMKLLDTIKQYQEEGQQKSYLDFGIHGALFDPASQIEEIPQAFDLGVSSFKMFMAYAKLKWMTDDYHLTKAMDLISNCGGLAMVHAENGMVTDYLEDRSLKNGEDQKKVFLKTRPDLLEAEAIFRAVTLAAVTRCPLYIVHVSTAKGVIPIQQAKEEGQVLYAETSPLYLTLTDSTLQKLGPLAKVGPALRTEKDRLALWKAIQKGIIDTIASDHAPKAKKKEDPFFEAPYGAPAAETMLTVTYDEGVNKRRVDPRKLARLFSENPARIFGLYPKKGVLQKGSDADLILLDPNQIHTIRHESQHSGAPYTLFEGRRCRGKVVLTMQRGRILVENGDLRGKPGEGRFLATRIKKVKL
ncbi:MAG: dihydroorotase family protein [Thermodesulfobacteriota bacterium]